MSKYQKLWSYIKNSGEDTITLTFDQIGEIAGVPLDHSFLNVKKELQAYGYEVVKISLKKQTVLIQKLKQTDLKSLIEQICKQVLGLSLEQSQLIQNQLEQEQLEELENGFRVVSLSKGTYPVKQGDHLDAIFIIMKGLVRGFYLDEEGRDITKCFSCENEFFSAEGLVSSDTASFSVECLEPVEAVRIPYEVIDQLEVNSMVREAVNSLLKMELVNLERRTKYMLLSDALQRYQHFLADYPGLSHRLKQKYIASYLGISPVTLSRIRRKEETVC